MILVDTDVISALRRLDRAGSAFAAWSRRTPVSGLYLSAVTILEIEVGVLQMERRDPAQGARLRVWLREKVLAPFEGRILPFDLPAARQCAGLHVPNKRPGHDAMIAATALAHGVPVATGNTRDFAGTGVELINPWEGD